MTNVVPKEFFDTSKVSFSVSIKRNREWLYTIKLFDKETSKHLSEFMIPRVSLSEINFYKEYYKQMTEANANLSLLDFRTWKRFYENSFEEFLDFDDESEEMQEHQIKTIFLEWKQVCRQFESYSKEAEKIFENYRNSIEQLSQISSIEEIHIDATLSDVYWTTTMEWQKETKEEINDYLKDKKNRSLTSVEAKNIFEWFSFVWENTWANLDMKFIQKIHEIATKWLDELKDSWLDYKSAELRDGEIDMWIFMTWNWEESKYFPPKNWAAYINNLIAFMNEWELTVAKIWLFHLIYYWTHPFWNWNKRTTRLLESYFIQKKFDYWHLCLWMWFYFKKNLQSYFSNVRKVLTSKSPVRDWILFYVDSFKEMWLLSLKNAEAISIWSVMKVLPFERKKYYDEKDEVFYKFYKRQIWWFERNELKDYVKQEWLFENSLSQSLSQRLEKHLKDWIVEEKWSLFNKQYRQIRKS